LLVPILREALFFRAGQSQSRTFWTRACKLDIADFNSAVSISFQFSFELFINKSIPDYVDLCNQRFEKNLQTVRSSVEPGHYTRESLHKKGKYDSL
jgi:hypothetical protein